MKKMIMSALLLGLPLPVMGQAEETPIGENTELETAIDTYNWQTKLFEEIMHELRTHDFFGGRFIEVPFRGKVHVIDRTSEQLWYKKQANPPRPNLATLSGLIGKGNGKGGAGLNLRIKVTYRDYDQQSGKLVHEEIWEIDSGAFLEAQLSMDEAKSKQHK